MGTASRVRRQLDRVVRDDPHGGAVNTPDPKLVAECCAENRARLMAVVALVQAAIANIERRNK